MITNRWTMLAVLTLGALGAQAAPVVTPPSAKTGMPLVRQLEEVRHRIAAMPPDRRGAGVRLIQALGPAALPELMTAASRELARTTTEAADRAYLAALIEGIGTPRDPTTAELLERAFLARGFGEKVTRAAAKGLGRLCGARQITLLGNHAKEGAPLASAALDGLGHCRTSAAAEPLLAQLSALSEDHVALAAQALGNLGSSWA